MDPTAMILQCPWTGNWVQPIEVYAAGLPFQRWWKCPACDTHGGTLGRPGFRPGSPQIHAVEVSAAAAILYSPAARLVEVTL